MYEFNDNELGKIVVKPHARAKRIIARKTNGHIQLTIPQDLSLKKISEALDEMRPKLLNFTAPEPLKINEDTVIETFSFTARLSRTNLMQNVQMKLKDNELTVFLPLDFDLKTEHAQHIVKEMIKAGLRHKAKHVLPRKTMAFAQKFNLQVSNVKINKSVSRWGSCSGKKNINFSLYLLLLPEKYIDYVVLHELAHTVEMNHSEKFWKLLSGFCGEDAKKLSQEIKKNTPEVYSLLVS
ncbi:MAG: M48 family metallopeptidase [Bacteroidia bacterium]|nr:M48 family metallopeptidase [Bacteroidia bacterium]